MTKTKNETLAEMDDIIDKIAQLKTGNNAVDGFLTNAQLEIEKASHLMRIKK